MNKCEKGKNPSIIIQVLSIVTLILLICSLLTPWWYFNYNAQTVYEEGWDGDEQFSLFWYRLQQNRYDTSGDEDILTGSENKYTTMPNIVSVWDNKLYGMDAPSITTAFCQMFMDILLCMIITSLWIMRPQSKYHKYYSKTLISSLILSFITFISYSLFFNHPYHTFFGSQETDDGYYHFFYNWGPGIGWYLSMISCICLTCIVYIHFKGKMKLSSENVPSINDISTTEK